MKEKRKRVTIYTDGACSGNPGPGGYGAILMYNDSIKEIFGSEEQTTNNKMEMLAVIEALKMLKEPCEVEINSDSTYVVDSVEKGWVFSWKKKNWIKSDKKPAKNIELWEELLKLMDIHNIKFIKVKGHSDNEYNNRCDELARNAIHKLEKHLI